MNLLARAGLALGCAVLGACTSMSPQPVPIADAVARKAATAFELEGRLSASDTSRAASGRIEWQHARDSDRWTVLNPLGQIAARLERSPRGAELVTADGRQYRAATAEALLPELIGIDIPVERLTLWVQAAPPTDAEVREIDPLGRPALLIDQGWRIDYLEYASADASAAPRRIEVSRGDARLRLIIDQWTPTP